jgi:hypothetical protein
MEIQCKCASALYGLEVHGDKIKYLIMFHDHNVGQIHIKIGNDSFERI